MTKPAQDMIPAERIERMILQLRGQKVMIDLDLAALYGVETKALKRAVKRNLHDFLTTLCLSLTVKMLQS